MTPEQLWLIADDAFSMMQNVRERALSEEDLTFAAGFRDTSREAGPPRNLRVNGRVAHISVLGVLTKRPDFLSCLLGLENTTYPDIESAFADAEADAKVQSIELFVDSPGGQVAGLFEAIHAIRYTKKPIRVRANLAASAAYALAAAPGKPIKAVSPTSTFGSVGVVASFPIRDDVIHVTSTNAPHKRPDVQTEAGRAVVRTQLDAVHELFVEAVAKGRGTTVGRVHTEFGRGSVFLAEEARRRGMIDSVVPMPPPRRRG